MEYNLRIGSNIYATCKKKKYFKNFQISFILAMGIKKNIFVKRILGSFSEFL